jgi:hypothetical protein
MPLDGSTQYDIDQATLQVERKGQFPHGTLRMFTAKT